MGSFVSAAEAVSPVKSGDRVFVHGMAAAPQRLVNALVDRAPELKDVEVVHLHTEGKAPHAAPEMAGHFFVNNLFIGGNVRTAVREGRADYVPVFLSEVPVLFRKGVLPLDVALFTVAPPDKHGFCSLGVSVDASLAAFETAKYKVAVVNPNMPYTLGDGCVPISAFDALVEGDEPLASHAIAEPDEIELKIGRLVASLVDDGATLQMGIGAIPNAVLASLTGHKGIGIHTEMFSDGVIDLVEKGVITGEHKTVHPNRIVAGFMSGSSRLYEFADRNPFILMRDIAFVNDTSVIRKLPKMTAINSAIEIDITGQVCADSIGCQMFSGVGGQMDFVRGASLAPDGKPIFALPSRTGKGIGRIVPMLKPGAGVVTTRAHVHYVVTEYGIADLYGKNLRQRAKALTEIAHPDDREGLEKAAAERWC